MAPALSPVSGTRPLGRPELSDPIHVSYWGAGHRRISIGNVGGLRLPCKAFQNKLSIFTQLNQVHTFKRLDDLLHGRAQFLMSNDDIPRPCYSLRCVVQQPTDHLLKQSRLR